jgi:hypothetical protein
VELEAELEAELVVIASSWLSPGIHQTLPFQQP